MQYPWMLARQQMHILAWFWTCWIETRAEHRRVNTETDAIDWICETASGDEGTDGWVSEAEEHEPIKLTGKIVTTDVGLDVMISV